jgi:hypothetical protein
VELLKNPQENHFFFSQNKIAEPLKDIFLCCDISVPEILIPLTVLCVFTDSQVSHSGPASAELPSGDNTQPVIVITSRFLLLIKLSVVFLRQTV